MTAYTFCIDSMILGYREYQSIAMRQSFGTEMETYFVNEKFTRSTGHGYQEVIDGTPAATCWARA